MILVLCLNAALDKTLVLERLRPGRRNSPRRRLDLAGGKGVNAARAARLLGLDARVLGFVAGRTGERIASLLEEEGVPADWVRLPDGESRTCLTLVHGPGLPTEVNEEGPRVPPAALCELERRFLRSLRGCRFVLLCGRLPPGVPADRYARFIRLARSRGVPCALDASEPALSRALRERPDIVKPNRTELRELGLPASPAALRRLNALEAFATLGPDGALMRGAEGFLRARVPVYGGCPLGAGDGFLAAAVFGRLKGWPAPRRLAFAAAVASASLRTLGAGLFQKAHLREALAKVRVEAL